MLLIWSDFPWSVPPASVCAIDGSCSPPPALGYGSAPLPHPLSGTAGLSSSSHLPFLLTLARRCACTGRPGPLPRRSDRSPHGAPAWPTGEHNHGERLAHEPKWRRLCVSLNGVPGSACARGRRSALFPARGRRLAVWDCVREERAGPPASSELDCLS